MSQEWFVVRDGKEHGPFTLAALKDRAAKGFLAPNTLIRHINAERPVRASSIKGLFPTPSTTATKDDAPAQGRPVAKKKSDSSKKTLIIASVATGALRWTPFVGRAMGLS